jgi:hypothetical protein
VTFDPANFTTTSDAAQTLRMIDQVVECGVCRERATRIVAKVEAIIGGPFADILESLHQPNPRKPDAEVAFIQTAFFSYLMQWVDEREVSMALTQSIALARLAELDAEHKDTI